MNCITLDLRFGPMGVARLGPSCLTPIISHKEPIHIRGKAEFLVAPTRNPTMRSCLGSETPYFVIHLHIFRFMSLCTDQLVIQFCRPAKCQKKIVKLVSGLKWTGPFSLQRLVPSTLDHFGNHLAKTAPTGLCQLNEHRPPPNEPDHGSDIHVRNSPPPSYPRNGLEPKNPPQTVARPAHCHRRNPTSPNLPSTFRCRATMDIRRVNTAGQHRGRKYPPTPSCVVLTQAQHGPEKDPPTPFVHPMATQEAEDFVLCCVVLCCVVLCCVVLCCVVLGWVGLGWVVLCCVVLCCVVLCCVVLCCVVLCCVVLQQNTTQHNTTQQNKKEKHCTK